MVTRAEQQPLGRQQVMAAIIDAANRLIAKRGSRNVSLREIAAEAGVNYGLVHRHFGSREEVLRAVFDEAVRAGVAEATPHHDLATAIGAVFRLQEENGIAHVIAWALLEELDLSQIHTRYATLWHLVDLAKSETDEHSVTDVRIRVGTLAAAMLGWHLFRSFLLTGLDLDEADPDVESAIIAELERLASPPYHPHPTAATE